MITFVHTADIHFGMENYGRVDPQTGIHTRLLDFKKSLETCIDDAIARNVDLFLFSGDAYKTAYPSPTQQRLLMELFFKLFAANIPVVIVVGNHDQPLSFGKTNAIDVFSQVPIGGFHVFSKPGILRLVTKNGPIQIVGIPWPTRHNVITKDEHRTCKSTEITAYLAEQVGSIITTFAEQLNPDEPAVLAAHLTVSNGIFSGSEKCAVYGSDPLFLPSSLAHPAFDYVALGHLHRYQNLNPNGYPAVVYAGSIDRIDFGERKETKGYCIVKIETGCDPDHAAGRKYRTSGSHEFVPLKTRPFIQVDVELPPGSDHTAIVLAAIGQYDITDAIVKIKYYINEDGPDLVDLSAITAALKPALYVAGIVPVRAPRQRTQRVAVNVQMDIPALIDAYLGANTALSHKKDRLRAKALELVAQLESLEQVDT